MLGLERIDLLPLHRNDAKAPLADQLGALVELRGERKIGRIELPEVSVPQIEAAQAIPRIWLTRGCGGSAFLASSGRCCRQEGGVGGIMGGDTGQQILEVVPGEGPVERFGQVVVAHLEAGQPVGDFPL